MSTPTISFRVSPDQQTAVREIVNATKSDPDLTASVLKFIRRKSESEDSLAEQGVGPFRNAKAALSTLTTTLSIAFDPDAIFLFGSRARGTARPDSNFNLMIVTPGRRTLDFLSIRTLITGCGIPVDVVPCKSSTFMKDRKVPGMLPHVVDQEGRLLHARIGGPFWKRYRSMFPARWLPTLF